MTYEIWIGVIGKSTAEIIVGDSFIECCKAYCKRHFANFDELAHRKVA